MPDHVIAQCLASRNVSSKTTTIEIILTFKVEGQKPELKANCIISDFKKEILKKK